MSSRGSISSRSSTPSRHIAKKTLSIIHGSADLLERNNIFIEEELMDETRWFDLAFSLGMPSREGQRSNTETQKLAQKMKRRKVVSQTQTSDMLKPFIESITKRCPKLSQRDQHAYRTDAVPTLEAHRNTIHRLPTPKPAVSIGYCRAVFSSDHDELQNGIIAGPNGEPCDLNHVSQPVLEHFWPFFVVEISDTSMAAAQQATAVSAATCNNALSLLVGAAAISDKDWTHRSFKFDPKFLRTFSLSVHGKMACLSAHSFQRQESHIASPISTYALDDEHDVAALADRIYSIMIWAQFNRLGEIIATLDQLDEKVHGFSSGLKIEDDPYDFDPSCLRTLKLQSARRPDRTKIALKAGLPRWFVRPQQFP